MNQIFSYHGNGSFANMQQIDAWQGSLHRQFRTIHIAGTNGKGSVAYKIAAALRETGAKVGLYTSPHIQSYRERIQINGSLIPDEFVKPFLAHLFSFLEKEKIEPSFFELLTAAAFDYFACEKVDIAVLETGMGGRFDPTNVVTPILSVITSIEADHTEILGSTLDEIAYAKAGIIKPNVPVVVGPRAQLGPILTAAGDRAILVPSVDGCYDRENSAIARAALQALEVPEAAIALGLKIRPPCRFEIVDPRPIILDVAHNPDGFSHLCAAIEEECPDLKFNVLLAMGKKKDAIGCARNILPIASRIACYSNGNERIYSSDSLTRILQSNGIAADRVRSIEELVALDEPLLICGSFYIMADAIETLSIKKSAKRAG